MIFWIVVLAGFGTLICVLSDWIEGVKRKRREIQERRPGFEVKLNTGEEPVLKERRETDHG